MQNLFGADDRRALATVVPDMMREAEVMRSHLVSPTAYERSQIDSVILTYVRHLGRKIYGGRAIDAALVSRGEMTLYPAGGSDVGDIEFYSTDPTKDVIALCNEMHRLGFAHVQSREAIHIGTLTISVSCVRVCDVTFLPRRVFDAVVVQRDRPWFVHPEHSLVDLLRILNDPATSYWKLDKMLPRLFSVLDALDTPAGATPGGGAGRRRSRSAAQVSLVPVPERGSVVPDAVWLWACGRASCALVYGAPVLEYYWTPAFDEEAAAAAAAADVDADAPPSLTVVSTSFEDDVQSLVLALSVEGERLTVSEFAPLGDWLGRCTRVATGSFAVNVYDSQGKVVPVSGTLSGGEGPHVASFNYVASHLLGLDILSRVQPGQLLRSGGPGAARAALVELVAKRRSILDATKCTVVDATCVLDVSRFRDVCLSYIGRPVPDSIAHRNLVDERRASNEERKRESRESRQHHGNGGGGRRRNPPTVAIWFSYDPVRPNASCHRIVWPVSDGRALATATHDGHGELAA